MRCKDCGYDGVENVAGGKCIKCGSLLQYAGYSNEQSDYVNSSNTSDPNLKQTVIQANASSLGIYNSNRQESDLKKTVVQSFPDYQPEEMKATITQGNENNRIAITPDEEAKKAHKHLSPISVEGKLECPNCHYPLSSDDLDSCPNCMADFTGLEDDESEETEELEFDNEEKKEVQQSQQKEESPKGEIKDGYLIECDNCKKKISSEFSFCPYCASKVVQKTIMSRKKKKVQTTESNPSKSQSKKQSPQMNMSCHLSLIPEDDENIEAITNNYEGEKIILNRTNTEPNNPTITSKEQAEIYFENDNWFIENRSQFRTTYIAVNRRVQLTPGDIIMLGDRRFMFGVNEAE